MFTSSSLLLFFNQLHVVVACLFLSSHFPTSSPRELMAMSPVCATWSSCHDLVRRVNYKSMNQQYAVCMTLISCNRFTRVSGTSRARNVDDLNRYGSLGTYFKLLAFFHCYIQDIQLGVYKQASS